MGKGIVKLGEGNWAVKDGNLLAAKETNGRFKNAEFTVSRGTDATYVGRDGLIKRFSSGLANEVANGDFELGDNGDWSLPSGWSISNNQLVGNDPSGFATVANVFYANKSYRLDVDVAERDSGSFSIISNSTDSNSNATPAIDSAGIHTFYFHIGTIGLETLYVTFGGDFVGKINSITVRDIEDFDDRPRIDFTENTDGHLLLEPQSTNLVTYSEDFSQWSKEATVTLTPNYGISPDGTQNSTRMQMNADDSVYVSASSGLTASFYVKGTLGETIRLSNGSATAHTLTGNWDRIETYDSSSTSSLISINTYSGATARDIEIWGAQAEALSYATSYIPTNGSTVTRDAETCTGAGEAIDFNSEEGVLYAEIAALANSNTVRYLGLNDGSSNNRVVILNDGTANRIRAIVSSGGTKYADLYYNVTDVTDFHKIAIKYKANDFALWIDGVERATDTSGSAPIGLNDLDFELSGGNFYGKCKAIRAYKEALSDSELTALTS